MLNKFLVGCLFLFVGFFIFLLIGNAVASQEEHSKGSVGMKSPRVSVQQDVFIEGLIMRDVEMIEELNEELEFLDSSTFKNFNIQDYCNVRKKYKQQRIDLYGNRKYSGLFLFLECFAEGGFLIQDVKANRYYLDGAGRSFADGVSTLLNVKKTSRLRTVYFNGEFDSVPVLELTTAEAVQKYKKMLFWLTRRVAVCEMLTDVVWYRFGKSKSLSIFYEKIAPKMSSCGDYLVHRLRECLMDKKMRLEDLHNYFEMIGQHVHAKKALSLIE